MRRSLQSRFPQRRPSLQRRSASRGCIIAPTEASMKTWLMAGVLAFAILLYAFQPLPRCTSVEPDTAKAGATVSVKGENLNKGSIAEVYITDGRNDTKVT